METKPQNGGRELELNKISAPAVQSARPVFFRLEKSESPEPLSELAKVRELNRQHQPVKLVRQTLNSFNL